MATKLGQITLNSVLIIICDVNPIIAGLVAPIGSIASAVDGSGLYCKTASGNTSWEPLSSELIVANRQTASYTLVLSDANKLVEMNVASANNLTIPLDATVAYPIGTQILISQYGAGQTTIVATGGVTIRSYNTQLKLTGQYAMATLIKIATDEWYLSGNTTT